MRLESCLTFFQRCAVQELLMDFADDRSTIIQWSPKRIVVDLVVERRPVAVSLPACFSCLLIQNDTYFNVEVPPSFALSTSCFLNSGYVDSSETVNWQ